jgi:hypothetical protein
MLRNDADAEDVVQDTFLRAFRAIGRFERGREFRVVAVHDSRQSMPHRRHQPEAPAAAVLG